MTRRHPGAVWYDHLRVGEDDLMVLELPMPRPEAPLTRAEREVAEALVGGLSYQEIAARRGTSPATVANQVAAVFRKLGVSSRTEAAAHLARARTE